MLWLENTVLTLLTLPIALLLASALHIFTVPALCADHGLCKGV